MHLQRQGDEHAGSGNRGAWSLKKRLSCSSSVAGHAPGPPTTLTACHGCLRGPGIFVFVTTCGSCYAIRYDDTESRTVSLSLEFLLPSPESSCTSWGSNRFSCANRFSGGSCTYCEPHERFTRFVLPCCKMRSVSDQIAKVQPLTTNPSVQRLGNVRKIDTFAYALSNPFCCRQLSCPSRRVDLPYVIELPIVGAEYLDHHFRQRIDG